MKRKVLCSSSALLLIFSIFMIRTGNRIYVISNADDSHGMTKGTRGMTRMSYSAPPEPPRNARSKITSEKLYIAIIDRDYEPSPIQCALKTSWISDALKLPFVDGVEFYSSASFTNTECGITSISFNSTAEVHNPSCLIMRNVIKSFLERSDAGWLLYVTDGAFVDVTKLRELLFKAGSWDPVYDSRIRGHCTEVRDYFQVFAQNSGGLMSRGAASKLNITNKTWEVACAIEIDGNEALAHALDINGVYAISSHDSQFLGHPFVSKSDYDALLKGKFNTLKLCPSTYQSGRVCSPTVQSLSNLVVWAGEGEHMDKMHFIQRAKDIIDNVPYEVNFIYNVYKAELCMNK